MAATTKATGSLREIPPGVWALGFVSMLMDTSSEMIYALFPVYLVTVMGAPMVTVGLIEGIAEATASVTKVFSGAISDWLGRRKLLAVIGYGLAALIKPVFPVAPSVGWLMAARFFDRVGKGIRGAPRDALVAEIAPVRLRGASFGLRQSLDTVGAFLGPLIGIGIMWWTADNFTIVFWVAVAPAFLAVVLLIYAVREPDRPEGRRKPRNPLGLAEIKSLGAFYWWIVAVGVAFTLARFSEAFLVLRAQNVGVPVMWAPAVLVIMNIVYALAAYPAGALSDRVDRGSLLLSGVTVLIGADLVLAMLPNIWGLAFGVVLWGLHMGITQGLFAALVADASPLALRGTAYGFFNLLTGVMMLAASIIAGVLWDVAGPKATFATAGGFAILALGGLLIVRGRLNPTVVE